MRSVLACAVVIVVTARVLASCASDAIPVPDAVPRPDPSPVDAASGDDAGACVEAGVAAPHVCGADGTGCPILGIAGAASSPTPTFNGFADPVIVSDPGAPQRRWLAYSYLEGKAQAIDGGTAGLAGVSTHLARSDDGGPFVAVGPLWPSTQRIDPEGTAESWLNSESVGITSAPLSGGSERWFGVHFSYFLEPRTGFFPRFSSFHLRIGAASSLQGLASAEEAVAGTSFTSAAWKIDTRLDRTSPDVSDCQIWNNPGLAFDGGLLYLVTECQVYRGDGAIDPDRSRVVIFRTAPTGLPRTWTWTYAGVLGGRELAREMGFDVLVSPEVTRTDGGWAALFAPRPAGGSSEGCIAIELVSLDPPRVKRDCEGRPVVRTRIEPTPSPSRHLGSCTHLGSGVVATWVDTSGGFSATLHRVP